MTLSRRRFLAGVAGGVSAALVGCRPGGSSRTSAMSGGFLEDRPGPGSVAPGAPGASSGPRGPSETVRLPVVIVGAGLSGLTAAWWLERRGLEELAVLEAGSGPGGDARWGRAAGLLHPWGGRHVACPGLDDIGMRTLLEDLGVIDDGRVGELARVRAPIHRLFRWGRWRRGLDSALFETEAERRGWGKLMERARETRREQGRMEPGHGSFGPRGSGSDPGAEVVLAGALERTTMAHWLGEAGVPSGASTVRWLVDHLCRDDYGVPAGAVSARAGLAALLRHGTESPGLSWPEGTGWIARRLSERLGERITAGAPVTEVRRDGTGLRVTTPGRVYRCEAVVWAAPASAAAGVVEGAPELEVKHAPWVVANLTLEREPSGKGVGRAWHNVRMGSRSTGYVPADHQTLRTTTDRTVWTWYRPLDDMSPGRALTVLARRSWAEWVEVVLDDLAPAHPDIRRCVSRVDIRRMARGTPVPEPGLLGRPARLRMRRGDGSIAFAHTELEGLPRAENAVRGGVRAARLVAERLGVASG